MTTPEPPGGPHARNSDPDTSRVSAQILERQEAAEVMMDRLLTSYARAACESRGLADFEVIPAAGYGPKDGAWKRCSDLRKNKVDGVLVPLTEQLTYPNDTGVTMINPETHRACMVCTITSAGVDRLRRRGVWPS